MAAARAQQAAGRLESLAREGVLGPLKQALGARGSRIGVSGKVPARVARLGHVELHREAVSGFIEPSDSEARSIGVAGTMLVQTPDAYYYLQ